MSCTSCSGTPCVGCGACAESTTVTETPPCAPTSFCTGNYTITYDGQCLTKTLRTDAIPDGTYKNADLTFVNGCLTKVQEGTPSSTVLASPCTSTTTPSGGNFGASGQCNLTSVSSSGQITTTATLEGVAPLFVTGCGSSAQPWVVSFDGESIGGVNFDLCGTRIEGGIVKSFTPPITDIFTDDPNLQVDIVDCRAEIKVKGQLAKEIVYSRPVCCTGTDGKFYFLGMGSVTMLGSGARVSFCWVNGAAPQYSPPPSVFTGPQAAVSWLDAMTVVCPAVAPATGGA
jgi:hypothetical protein